MILKTGKYMALMAVCMLTYSACSTDESLSVSETDHQGKTPIELTVGIAGEGSGITRGTTRTVITDGTDKPTPQYLSTTASTSLYMVIKSEDATTPTPKAATYTSTIGTVEANTDAVTFGSGKTRYWDDTTHERQSQLTIYSACVPGATTDFTIGTANYTNSAPWSTTVINPTVTWPLRETITEKVSAQTADFVNGQDLCFSNNVSYPTEGTDNRIKFNDGTKKFGGGSMIFYHALTKITFKLKSGTGFETTDPFAFPTAKNIELKGFNTSGTFNIITGEFGTPETGTISKLAPITPTETGYKHVVTGLLLPGTDLNDETANTINITIDNNEYHLKKSDLKTALTGKTIYTGQTYQTSALTDDHKMRPGVEYVFEITIGKKEIDNITASVVNWETVTAAETDAKNARITVALLDASSQEGSTTPTSFDLYRTKHDAGSIPTDENTYARFDWQTGYNTDGKATLTASGSHYNTNWYWPDNKTFYHFRAVYSPVAYTITTTDGKDYISLTSGPGTSYNDVKWGAPFKAKTDNTKPDTEDDKLTYSTTTGFDNTKSPGTAETDHQISKAIGATDNPIRIVMFHMMSDVTIQLTTTAPADPDYIELTGATLMFNNIALSATVRMGDGLVTAGSTGDFGNTTETTQTVDTDKKWHYGFVPQDLTNVGLTIETTDGNRYIVGMGSVVAASLPNNLVKYTYPSATGGGVTINRWLPNYKYTYTFRLTKKGIDNITSTLVAWDTVSAGNDDVQIQ